MFRILIADFSWQIWAQCETLLRSHLLDYCCFFFLFLQIFFSMWMVREQKIVFSSNQPWFCDALDKRWALLINRNKLHRPKISKGDARQRVTWVSEAGDDEEQGAPLSVMRALALDSSLIEAWEANGSRRHHPLISPSSHTAVKGYEWHYPKLCLHFLHVIQTPQMFRGVLSVGWCISLCV